MKRVLVTGATRGLGLAISRRLLAEGYHVVATGRAETDELRKLREGAPDQISVSPFDLSNTESIPAFVQGLVASHGPFYGLVNNAAVGTDGVLGTMHNSEIERVIRLNTVAPIILSKYIVRGMMARRAGRVINISSIIASTGFSGLSVYAASKASLEGFTRSLAREVGKLNITVNAVAPGYMQTDMTAGLQGEKFNSILRRSPMGRLAEPPDAAAMVAYLLGPDSGAITGTVMTVDAGSTC